MTDDVKIITLTPDDWRKYREIRLEALKEEPLSFLSTYEEMKARSPKRWQERLASPDEISLFVKSKNKIVGMAQAYREKNPRLAHLATIVAVYLNKDFRGQGLGRKLLERLIEEIKKWPGTEKIKITVNPDKTAAYNLYKSLGFREVGRFEKEVKIGNDYFDEVLFEMPA